MSKILRADYVQKEISILKQGGDISIVYNQGRDNEIKFKNGNRICSGCMNCINPQCINLSDKSVECREFPEISHDMNRLICPVNAIKSGKEKVSVDESKCIGCGLCAMNCPIGAIYLKDGKAYDFFNAIAPPPGWSVELRETDEDVDLFISYTVLDRRDF